MPLFNKTLFTKWFTHNINQLMASWFQNVRSVKRGAEETLAAVTEKCAGT